MENLLPARDSRAVERHPSSFRDPAGFLFQLNGILYRQVNPRGKESYDRLIRSGLYDRLVTQGDLLPHREVPSPAAAQSPAYKLLQPEPIPFISYPYEWCFSQLKDAALLTLRAHRLALESGMSLKDASAYNVQFSGGRPILIDTLSFELLREGRPWVAYRQFCQHFLAPLALAAHRDARLQQLLRVHLDGIPLDLADSLLPLHAGWSPALLVHLRLHARAQRRFAGRTVPQTTRSMSRNAHLGLLDQLESAIRALRWRPAREGWLSYYGEIPQGAEALEQKRRLVAALLDRIQPAPRRIWDLGANVGLFSRLAAARGWLTLSFDSDAGCVEQNYQQCVSSGERNLLPLVLDLTNPSPGLGWEHRERSSLVERGPADGVLALGLLHHLTISNQLPFENIAQFLGGICR